MLLSFTMIHTIQIRCIHKFVHHRVSNSILRSKSLDFANWSLEGSTGCKCYFKDYWHLQDSKTETTSKCFIDYLRSWRCLVLLTWSVLGDPSQVQTTYLMHGTQLKKVSSEMSIWVPQHLHWWSYYKYHLRAIETVWFTWMWFLKPLCRRRRSIFWI